MHAPPGAFIARTASEKAQNHEVITGNKEFEKKIKNVGVMWFYSSARHSWWFPLGAGKKHFQKRSKPQTGGGREQGEILRRKSFQKRVFRTPKRVLARHKGVKRKIEGGENGGSSKILRGITQGMASQMGGDREKYMRAETREQKAGRCKREEGKRANEQKENGGSSHRKTAK